MISAVDSSLILDVVIDDPAFADASEECLRDASVHGQLVACECVLAEIWPAFSGDDEFEEFLADWQIQFSASSAQSAKLAGRLFGRYLDRGGKQGRVAADFLIGAHAQCHADRLLARDRGYLRDYFSELVVVDPSA